MNFPRSTFRDALRQLIYEREIIEKSWGYTRDSAFLAAIRDLYNKTEKEESVIWLYDLKD